MSSDSHQHWWNCLSMYLHEKYSMHKECTRYCCDTWLENAYYSNELIERVSEKIQMSGEKVKEMRTFQKYLHQSIHPEESELIHVTFLCVCWKAFDKKWIQRLHIEWRKKMRHQMMNMNNCTVCVCGRSTWPDLLAWNRLTIVHSLSSGVCPIKLD